jgi:aspartyl-tRNA(Asn)/glutamyl-tRNA(Gln) amidotransferase subunit B
MNDLDYKAIIGLEIHVQLATATKMFCGCELDFGAEPNSNVCPVCLGLPGALPVMNKKAVEHSILAGLALNCKITEFTKWDRKSYYYPDLPKNYQISQYDLPIAEKGFIEIPVDKGGKKKIRITRAHLEEDAGKNVHNKSGYSQVDLNRAGTPLLEIVTEPDLNSGIEVKNLAVELQRIVRFIGVSHADMQKGQMRFEPNVNLIIQKDDKEYRTPIAEIKNLNSFRALEKSVDFEIARQLDEFIETGKTMEMGNKSTRGWDDEKEITVLQREKEEAHDYRYFPDPDLVPVKVSEDWLGEIKGRLGELPLDKQQRYISEYKLTEYDAGVLTSDRKTAEFFEAAVQKYDNPKKICNLITQTGLEMANETEVDIDELGITAENLAELAKMAENGKVNASAAEKIMQQMSRTKDSPVKIAEELELLQKNDAGELEQLVEQAIENNPDAVEQVISGGKKSKKARGFLMGQVMQKTKGRANPKIVSRILGEKLSKKS